MASTAKPLLLDRPFRTGFKFGLGLFAAWFFLGLIVWAGSLVVGGGLLAAGMLGLGSSGSEVEATDGAQPAERSGNPFN